MSIILLFKKLFSNTINFIFTLIIFSLIWSADLYIENVDLDSGTLDIMMTNDINIGGFQFNLSGLDITGASGGSATENGFMISNSSSTLLGFSLTGSSIPPGSGVLIDVTFEN